MNVNFNGYGENVLTFIADSGLTETGVPVKVIDDGTVAKCGGNDNFCGICVGLRDGYAAVQLAGYVRTPAAAKIAPATKSLPREAPATSRSTPRAESCWLWILPQPKRDLFFNFRR